MESIKIDSDKTLAEQIASLEKERDEWKEAYERVRNNPGVADIEKVYGLGRRSYKDGKCEWDNLDGYREGDPEIAKIREIAKNNYDIVRAVKVRQSMVEEKLEKFVGSQPLKRVLGRLKSLDDQVESLRNTVNRYDPNVRLDAMEKKVEFHNKLINDYVDDGVDQTEFDDEVLARLDKLERGEEGNCKDHDNIMDRLDNLDNMVGLLEKENTLSMNEQKNNFDHWKLLRKRVEKVEEKGLGGRSIRNELKNLYAERDRLEAKIDRVGSPSAMEKAQWDETVEAVDKLRKLVEFFVYNPMTGLEDVRLERVEGLKDRLEELERKVSFDCEYEPEMRVNLTKVTKQLEERVDNLEKEHIESHNDLFGQLSDARDQAVGLQVGLATAEERLDAVEKKEPVKSMGQVLTEASGNSKFLENEIDRRLGSLEKKMNAIYHPKLGGRE